MEGLSLAYILILLVCKGGHCWVCPTNTRVFTDVGQRPVLQFNTNGRHNEGDNTDTNTFQIGHNTTNIFTLNYESGVVFGTPYIRGCSLSSSADLAKGVLDIELDTVKTSDWGTYRLVHTRRDVTVIQCVTLYLLGNPTTPTITHSDTVYEGMPLSLTCSSQSTTQPSNHSLAMSYNWTSNGSKLTADNRFSFDSNLTKTLTISSLSRTKDNNRVMGCSATENKEKSSLATSYTINVQYGPENIRFNLSEDSHTYNDGDFFIPVTCLADCQPDCKFGWSKGGTSLDSTAVLNLGMVNSGTHGIYTCIATHTVQVHNMTKTLNVSIIYGPADISLSPPSTSHMVTEGYSLEAITCSTTCNPPCSYTWSRSAVTVNTSDVLDLGTVERGENGSYVCTARNPGSGLSKSGTAVNVSVRYGPDYVTLSVPNVHTVTEGDIVNNINCSAECWPGCAFIWTNLTDKQTIITSQVLAFGTVDRYDAGNYKCLARNHATTQYMREAENNFSLRVQYAPDVFISKSTVLWTEHTPLNLLCKASGVPAVYNYTGFVQRVGDVVVPNSHVENPGVKENISVNIPSLQLQDTGIYTCYVDNSITGVNKQLIQTASQRVDVQASPVVLLKQTTFAGETSGNITIDIPFVSVPEHTTYSVLRHDGQTVLTNENYILHIRNDSVNTVFYGQSVYLVGNVLQMTIIDLSEEEFGSYKLQIANDINTTNCIISVAATSKPSPPTELNLTNFDNVVAFEWKKGFNGGYEQTFVLQTSFNSNVSWTNKTIIKESEAKYKKENGKFLVNLANLHPGIYHARLVAFNLKGAADPVKFKEMFEVKELTEGKPASSSGALIGGTAGGCLGVTGLAVVAVFILLKRRKAQKAYDDSVRLTNGQKLAKISHRTGLNENIPDEVENPMYVSGDDVGIPNVTTADIYATPVKKKSKQSTGAGDIYSAVDKKRKHQDIYENNDGIQMKKGEHSTNKKQVNEDGLMYADIVFANQPKGQKRLVIHGIDEKTEYAQVDLTKRADPLPDSDEDQTEK